jgi:RNA polymerase sigma factor (TIGR02999 family)
LVFYAGFIMSEITRILDRVQQRDPTAAEELLPLVYEELRKLAAARMANEAPGQTLQATALVHEAWLRLVGGESAQFQNRSHFFAAAAEAMRRILVERARKRQRVRHGGGQNRVDLEAVEIAVQTTDERLLAVHEVLDELAVADAKQAEIVKLKFFVGLQNEEIAAALGISDKTVRRYWSHAKAWLYERIRKSSS